MHYKLIMFDFDGTLADTSECILNCINYTQEKMRLHDISESEKRLFIGPSMEESYNKYFGLTGERLKEAVAYHKEYAVQNGYKEMKWYPGIMQLLDSIKDNNMYISIVSLKAYDTILKILRYYNVENKFDYIYGTNQKENLSKKDLIVRCITDNGFRKNEVMLIGDSIYDAKGAEQAMVDFLPVTYGFGFSEKNEPFMFKNIGVANDACEIKKFLE